MESGFYLSCIMNREDRGYKEFSNRMSWLNFTVSTVSIDPNANFKDELNKELAKVKKKVKMSLFESHKSILFIKNNTGLLPSQIFAEMRKMNVLFSNVLRILPLDYFGKFDENKIRNAIEKSSISGTFKIAYEGRLCDVDLKEKMFQVIIPLVNCKVDLTNPEYVIIIQAFKSFVGLTVMKNDPRNFNVSLVQSLKNSTDEK